VVRRPVGGVQGKVDVCNLFWWEIEQCMNDDGKNLGCGEIGEDAESDGMGPGMGLVVGLWWDLMLNLF
jgi:hypothetical protein